MARRRQAQRLLHRCVQQRHVLRHNVQAQLGPMLLDHTPLLLTQLVLASVSGMYRVSHLCAGAAVPAC